MNKFDNCIMKQVGFEAAIFLSVSRWKILEGEIDGLLGFRKVI